MTQNAGPVISVAIVNWNGGEIFKRCLASIEPAMVAANVPHYEIVVIDNNSSDLDEQFLRTIPYLKFRKNFKNEMFARGTNQTIAMAAGDVCLILNNDIILESDAVLPLLDAVKKDGFDAAVPQLILPNGSVQKSITGLPRLRDVAFACLGLNYLSPRFDRWLNRSFDYSKMQTVEGQPAFSAMLISRRNWHLVGDMDEEFPLLWNDVDWFKRFQKRGFRCAYVPTSRMHHIHGMSTSKIKVRKIFESTVSMVRYFKKHGNLKPYEFPMLFSLSALMFSLGLGLELFSHLRSLRWLMPRR